MFSGRKVRILGIAGDPGGAAALSPVIAKLRDDPAVEVHLYAYYKAASVFYRAGLAYQTFDEKVLTPELAAELLEDKEIDLLITGTSENDYNLEKVFILGARKAGVRSLSVLDFWSNYLVRFSQDKNDLTCLPDRIAVMDQLAVTEMTQAGIPASHLAITGQPAFDDLLAYCRNFSPTDKRAVRKSFGIGLNGLLVVFVSQPISALYDLNQLGYDEKTVFSQLVQALERISAEMDLPLKLVFFPHLREKETWWLDTQIENVELFIASREDFRKISVGSDLVAGITSTKLVEAALMGCRTVSLQLGKGAGQEFDMRNLGIGEVVLDPEDIGARVRGMLDDQLPAPDRPQLELIENATDKVIDLVHELLENYADQAGLAGMEKE